MVSLTAIIRCKPDTVNIVESALIAVGDYAEAHEPGTISNVLTRSTDDPTVLVTQERFADSGVMTIHNEGAGSKAFFAATEGLLADVAIHIGEVIMSDCEGRRPDSTVGS